MLVFEVVGQESSTLTLKTPTGSLEGTLLYPASEKEIPIVIIIAGSGPTDRDGNNPVMKNNSLKMIAEQLSLNGIATVRFDKRGIAKSSAAGSDENNLRFEHYIEDANGWVNLVAKDDRFSEVIILGHSEGSLIGMVASRNNEVTKFISLAGSGRAAADIISEQLSSQPPFIVDQSSPILEKLKNGETYDSIPPMLYALFRPSVQPYMISWFQYDPVKELAKLDKPVLVVQGTNDLQVSAKDAQLLEGANANAKLVFIEGMNHVLKESPSDRQKNLETYSNPDLPLHPDLMKNVISFIRN